LEKTKKMVEEEIARAEQREKDRPADAMTALKDLKARTQELVDLEQALATDSKAVEKQAAQLRTLAPRQGGIEARAREVQADAATQAPEAARYLGEAARLMDRAEQTLADERTPRNPADHQQA